MAQQTGCLTEIFFDQAQERARFLDDLKSKNQLAGPLHGLPISLKDGFQVTGTQATLGLVGYLDSVSQVNSPLVDILLQLGAVVYVKTNIPQTLMVRPALHPLVTRTLLTHAPSPLIRTITFLGVL